jgi:SNF2 family DNA or RNA helicase
VEDQATDRAYRIGQKRTVYSMKLITKGTVEEKVLELQKRKKAIIDATLETDEQVM